MITAEGMSQWRAAVASTAAVSQTAGTTISTTGIGTFNQSDPFMFGYSFLSQPVLTYGAQLDNYDPTDGRAISSQGYCYEWITDDQGLYIGAYIGVRIIDIAIGAKATHHFHFREVAVKNFMYSPDVPGSYTIGNFDNPAAADETRFKPLDFWRTDNATAAADNASVRLRLTKVPYDPSATANPNGSLHVRQNGLDLLAAEYAVSGRTVTIPPSSGVAIRSGDLFDAEYAFDPTIANPPQPGAALRGSSSDSGDNGPSLASLALPTGTAIGDLIVVSASSNVAVTDARLTQVGTYMWIGFATTTSAIAATCSGAFGVFWSIACATFATSATSWSAPVVTSDLTMTAGDTLTLGSVSGYSAAVCALFDGNSYVPGTCSVPTGYSGGAAAGPALAHCAVAYWDNSGAIGTSPAGVVSYSSGIDGAIAVVVGLDGP